MSDPAPAAAEVFPTIEWDRDTLLLDIDGTILDIAPTPESVIVPESLKLSLSRIRKGLGGALALVTGRTLDAVDELFAPMKFAGAGAHGAEMRIDPEGAVLHCAAPLGASERTAFVRVASLDPRLRLEDKGYSVAIHYRSAPELGGAVITAVREEVAKLNENLCILCGKAVVEVKPYGVSKGTGLQHLMAHPPFSGRRPIFLGDDVTDEDGFAALPEFSGLGLSVGRLLPGAAGMINSPAEVREWLFQLSHGQPVS